MITTQLPDAVQWSEGMLLSPQHLQQNDIYWQAHLHHRLAGIAPHYWGVRRLAVQLIKDCITISDLECVLPNGLAVHYPGNQPHHPATPLTLDVSACRAGAAPLRVWLLVPERGAGAARLDDPARRYDSLVGHLTVDENTGDGEVAVGRLQIRYQLVHSASNPSAAHGACALLEVQRDAQGLLRIGSYHPPMTCLGASAHWGAAGLLSQLHAHHDTWWSQARQLVAETSGNGPDGKPNSGGVRNVLVARQLASALPALAVLLHAGSHPERLYQCLADVVGRMAHIAAAPLPLNMTPYQHDDCLSQFQAAWEYIDATLAVEFARIRAQRLRAPQPEYDIAPFQLQGQSSFACTLPQRIDRTLLVEVKRKHGQTVAETARWLSQANIADASLIPQLQRQRMPGARVRPLTADEISRCQLPAQADIFMIENRTIELDGIGKRDLFCADRPLCIEGHADAHMPAAIFLYQLLQQPAETA